VLSDFREGQYRVLVGCEVLTEGYDERRVRCIVMARPTQSKALYQQCVGRGLRLDPDGGKEDCLVLDVTDNGTRHQLVTAAHLFGGEVADCDGGEVRQAVQAEQARRQQALAAEAALKVRWRLQEESPWPRVPDLSAYRPRESWEDESATDKQVRALRQFGFEVRAELTKGEASYLLDQCFELEAQCPTPATPKQRSLLRRFGLWREGLSRHQAGRLIGQLRQGVR
jgi:superfamily II DNA or RNA helicase